MGNIGNKTIFSKNLKHYIKLSKKKNPKIAKELNYPYNTFLDWVNGNAYPRIDKIERMAEYFGIKKSDLIEEELNLIKIDSCNTVSIPVLGKIKAGIPIEAQENIIEYVDIPIYWTKGDKKYFGLKISGNSMTPKYEDGDTVIFIQTNEWKDNKDCAVMVNGTDAVFKKVVLNDNGMVLQSYNTDYDLMMYNKEQIENYPIRLIGIAVEKRCIV